MSQGPLLLFAFLALLAGGMAGLRWGRCWLISTVAGAAAALAAGIWVLTTRAVWEWHAPCAIGGEIPVFRLDGVAALFLVLLAVLGAAATIYSHEYWSEERHPRSARLGRVWWNFLLMCMGLVLLCANGLHFLIAWELFAVSSYFLITLERSRLEARRAGWLYLAASHAGTLCLFAFFALLAAKTGSWQLGPLRDHAELKPLFWVALVGFGLKAGMFPLHIWLPSAHANAPSHVSAILSGIAIKMGIYGLVRFTSWLPTPVAAGWVVAALGMVSAVLGVAFALGQHDLKRLLAYHSVENIGIILLGLGFAMIAQTYGGASWGRLALAGGLLHVWNHGLFKCLLFLGAGSVLHATGTRRMSRLGGLWRAMPWTAGLFALGAAAISALPPLNGLISEWLVYLGLFGAAGSRGIAAWAAIPGAILLAVTGALALACFVKVVAVVFLGAPRSPAAERARECGIWMRGPMLALAGACVVIGLAPILFWPALSSAVGAWAPGWAADAAPVPLRALGTFHLALVVVAGAASLALWHRARRNGLTRGPTWGCGYAAPTPRMQHTAGSFAGIITEWFAWILRPERRRHDPAGLFPRNAADHERTPETVLERVVEPCGRMIMTCSTAVRRLQHGRIQAYILYLVIGLAVLAMLAFAGGHR